MTPLDLAAIAAACEAGDEAALATIGERHGIALRLEILQALARRGMGRVPIPAIAAVAADAAAADAGIAWAAFQDGYCACVAVRDGERVVVGVGGRPQQGNTPATIWPELAPWSRQLASNRGRLEAWARAPARDRRELAVVARRGEARVASEAALLQRIVDDHDDVEARLVLADLLAEREDPRGELIHLGHGLATLPAGERAAREARITEILSRHRAQLAGEAATRTTGYSISGGFVDTVTMTAAAFRDHGERLLRAHPIRKLTIRPFGKSVVRALAAGPLELVRALELGGAGIREFPIAPLAHARFERLERLELDHAVLGGDDCETALAGLDLPVLRALELRFAALGARALRGLAANPVCAQLEELVLEHMVDSNTDSEGRAGTIADRVAETLALPALRTLRLARWWYATDERIARLVASAPGLETLQAVDSGSLTYAAAAACPALRKLAIRGNITRAALAGLLRLPALTTLVVDHHGGPTDWIPDVLLALPVSHPLRRVQMGGAREAELRARFPG